MMTWFVKYSKRFLRQKIFLVLLLVLPVGTFLFAKEVWKDDTRVNVGLVVTDKEDEFTKKIQNELLNRSGIINFCRVSKKEELFRQIQQGRFECGYEFSGDLEKKYRNNQFEKGINQYIREGSVFYLVARQAVLTSVFRVYGEQMLADYIMSSGLYETSRINKDEIRQKYNWNLGEQNTFTIETNSSASKEKEWGDYLLTPIHGGVALLILLAGFCGLARYKKDCQNQIPDALSKKWSRRMSLVSITVPVALMTISGILSEISCGFSFLSGKEIASLLIYDIIVVLFCDLLSAIRIKEGGIWLLAMIYLCISVLFTPIFFDLSILAPGIRWVSYGSLPYYFLNAAFGGAGQLLELCFVGALLFGANAWIKRRDGYGYEL